MANAAAAVQLEDEVEQPDAEPWVLEGWGDGPSVSEQAQQAALRLGPYVKNVPTTLVGLGGPGTRRVLSAGHQGRSPLKVSEARRKPGPAPPPPQGDRHISAPAAAIAAAQANTATVRRAPLQRSLELGDESDGEATVATSSVGGGGAAAALSHPVAPVPAGQARGPPAQRASPAAGPSARQHLASVPPQAPQIVRPGRRETGAGVVAAAAAAAPPAAAPLPWGSAAADGATNSPRHRSLSAEAYHSTAPAPGSGAASRAPAAASRGAPASLSAGAAAHPAAQPNHGHPPLPPQHLQGQLEPLSPAISRSGGSRAASGAGDSGALAERHGGAGSSGSDGQSQPARASSLNAMPTAAMLAHPSQSQSGSAAGGQAPQPPQGGLFTAGRRVPSFRAETAGLSGWDPEAPAVQAQQSPGPVQAASNVSLWTSPTALGAGPSGLQAATASAGRGSPLPAGQQPPRRDQASGGSRLQRGTGGPAVGRLDLALGPERSSERLGGQTGAMANRAPSGRPPAVHGGSRSASPDVARPAGPPAVFSAPQQDALTAFCASRAELGSAGAGSHSSSGALPPEPRGHGGSPGGLLVGMPVTVPMRVTSLTKAPPAAARVS